MAIAELKVLSLAQTDCVRAISLLQSFISDNNMAQSAIIDDINARLDDYTSTLRNSHAKIGILNDLLGCTQVLTNTVIFSCFF